MPVMKRLGLGGEVKRVAQCPKKSVVVAPDGGGDGGCDCGGVGGATAGIGAATAQRQAH